MSTDNPAVSAEIAGQEVFPDLGDAPVQTELRHIKLDAIRLNGNPRQERDEGADERLRLSIERIGVLTPIIVAPDEDDTHATSYVLVGGHRRLGACQALGHQTIPAQIVPHAADTPSGKLARQLIENAVRADLAPRDEALALQELIRALGLTEDGAAELLTLPAERVRKRLELLTLPEATQQLLSDGQVTLGNARTLAAIAARSAPVADAMARRIADGLQDGRELDRNPVGALRALSDAGASTDGDTDPAAFVVPFTGELDVVSLPDLAERLGRMTEEGTPKGDQARMMAQRLAQLPAGTQAVAAVETADVDAARAYGAVLDYAHDRYTRSGFLIDAEWAAQWLDGQIDELFRRLGEGPEEDDASDDSEEEENEEASERKAQREAALAARARNLAFGDRLREMDGLDEVGRDAAAAIAGLILEAHGDDLARGLSICRAEWLRTETRTLRSGEIRTREAFVSLDEARQQLDELLDTAPTGGALLNRLVEAVAAAALSDQATLPVPQRRPLSMPFSAGREETVVGRSSAALLAAVEQQLTPDDHARAKETLGIVDDGASRPVRDRRAARHR